MTDKLKPIAPAQYGGVAYDENSLVKKWTTNEKGALRYHLQLKMKEGKTFEVTYPSQLESNNAKVIVHDAYNTSVFNLAYGKIDGCSNGYDCITLLGCNRTVVDVSNDITADSVIIEDSKAHKSHDNVVIGSNSDKAYIFSKYSEEYEFNGAPTKLIETETLPSLFNED